MPPKARSAPSALRPAASGVYGYVAVMALGLERHILGAPWLLHETRTSAERAGRDFARKNPRWQYLRCEPAIFCAGSATGH